MQSPRCNFRIVLPAHLKLKRIIRGAMPLTDKEISDSLRSLAEQINSIRESLSAVQAAVEALKMTVAAAMNPADPRQVSQHIETLQKNLQALDPNRKRRKTISDQLEASKLIEKHGDPKKA